MLFRTLRLVAFDTRYVERNGHALALAERPGPVPHVGREKHQPSRFGLDRPERRKVEREVRPLRLAQREDARLVLADVRRKHDVKRGADPADRMDMVRMEALAVQ